MLAMSDLLSSLASRMVLRLEIGLRITSPACVSPWSVLRSTRQARLTPKPLFWKQLLVFASLAIKVLQLVNAWTP